MSIAYLNGAFLPLDQARISPLDRGFIFGDGVYEVIPAYQKRLFYLDAHLQRLENSLAKIRLDNPLSRPEWQKLLTELVARNSGEAQGIYLQITRGVGKRQHQFLPATTPTLFAMSWELEVKPPTGICAITLADQRWLHCDIKATALLANVLLRQEAVDAGCDEAILLRDGYVTEGAASNVFIAKDGCVMTPLKNHLILGGITRDVLLDLLPQHGIACQETAVSEAALRTADEIWLCSSTNEVRPVVKLDGEVVGNGETPLAMQVWDWYQKLK